MKTTWLIAALALPCVLFGAINDVTDKLENLGIPLAARYQDSAYGGSGAYARNVWTLKAFDGRLYIGCGNSSNGGPASNAGPVPVFSFDPATGKFAEEWKVPDEQIDVFHIFSDGSLYIPGHDPKESWDLGNFYRRPKGADGKWEKIRTLEQGVHCYDMEEFDGSLLACGYGTYDAANMGTNFVYRQGPRFYTFMKFPKAVYAVGVAHGKRKVSFKNRKTGEIVEREIRPQAILSRKEKGKGFEFVRNASPDDVFPDTPEIKDNDLKVSRPGAIGDHLVYIGGIVHNDHQIEPLAAYVAKDGQNHFTAKRIKLPKDAVPWYTLSTGNKIYLLFATADGTKAKYTNHIWQSQNGKTWTEAFCFQSETFARSMELLDGAFYFGLGTEIKDHGYFEGNSLKLKFTTDELSNQAGTILRYKAVATADR